jgi:four helix bundle protein
MKITKFEDIMSWQKSHLFTVEIYKVFHDCKDYSFRDQIRRASVSIMSNIAEGFERGTNNEFKHFLYIAKGSSAEVRSLLILALSVGYIPQNKFNELLSVAVDISRLISSLIKTL